MRATLGLVSGMTLLAAIAGAEPTLAIRVTDDMGQPVPGAAVGVNLVLPGPTCQTFFLKADAQGLAVQELREADLKGMLQLRFLVSTPGRLPTLRTFEPGQFDPNQEHEVWLQQERGARCNVVLMDSAGGALGPETTIRVLNIVAYQHLEAARAAGFSMLHARPQGPGVWSLPAFQTDEDFVILVEAPGTVDRFLAGPYSSADLRGTLTIKVPQSGSLLAKVPAPATLTYAGGPETRFPVTFAGETSDTLTVFRQPNAPAGAYILEWGPEKENNLRFSLKAGEDRVIERSTP